MTVWLLMVYVAGGFPPVVSAVDNIASEAECQRLGEVLVADAKRANSSNRFIFRCTAVQKAPSPTASQQ